MPRDRVAVNDRQSTRRQIDRSAVIDRARQMRDSFLLFRLLADGTRPLIAPQLRWRARGLVANADGIREHG
jgi:hypothetical protein